MSVMNTRANKRARSMERAARKAESAKRIPFFGVVYPPNALRNLNYLHRHGLI